MAPFHGLLCCSLLTGGFYPVDFNRSSTFDNRLKGAFNILYGDKTSAKGDYFNDVFTIGGATLQNLSMGIGLTTDIPFGLIGIGYSANEAGVLQGIFEQPYPNLPKQLVQEGFTSTVAYSMWLNDLGIMPLSVPLPFPLDPATNSALQPPAPATSSSAASTRPSSPAR